MNKSHDIGEVIKMIHKYERHNMLVQSQVESWFGHYGLISEVNVIKLNITFEFASKCKIDD